MQAKPNIVLILNDDMGFSDIGCYGGEIETPNLDRLAYAGLRFTQFYNSPRCSPSRASLLTGLHPHQTGIGVLTTPTGPEGYAGNLNQRCVTIAEALKPAGYRCYMSGKWHVANSLYEPSDTWPLQRGFDDFFGTIIGAGSFYFPNTLTRGNDNADHEAKDNKAFFYTDAINDEAVRQIREHQAAYPDAPFFQYVAHTAPHWPLHAHDEDIAKYKGRFDAGWDNLREARLARLVEMGIIHPDWQLTGRDPSQPPWDDAEDKQWLLRCMEVYAAQVDRMDQGIGRILNALEESGRLEDTLIIFLSDNGACAEPIPDDVTAEHMVNELVLARSHTRDGEAVVFGNIPELMPGPENTYESYGIAWANMSNTPFRLYKHWTHEGGVSTPVILHWPNGIKDKGGLRHTPCQLPDVMATLIEIAGAEYPKTFNGNDILPLEGLSLMPVLKGDGLPERPLFWEHEGNAAVRLGKWKLVKEYPGDWELYDMIADRTETNDIAFEHPKVVKSLSRQYEEWAKRCGVIPREKILEQLRKLPIKPFYDDI